MQILLSVTKIIIAMAFNDAKMVMLPDFDALATQKEHESESKKKTTFSCSDKTITSSDIIPAEIERIDPPSFKLPAICLGIYMVVGTIIYYTVRNQMRGKKTNDLIDAIYLTVVTLSTVGYGDIVPHTDATKLLSAILAFSGMAIIGLILCTGGHYLVVKQQVMLFRTLNLCQKVNPTDAMKEIEAENKLKFHKCVIGSGIMMVLMIVGTFVLGSLEKMDSDDAIYCVITTVTTLGFGDESFSTGSGRFFAILWIPTTSTGLAQLFLCLAELLVGKKQEKMIEKIIAKKCTPVDLEAMTHVHDDYDKVVG